MIKKILAVGVSFLFLIIIFTPMTFGYNVKLDGVSDGPPLDSPWPMHCHDVRHTGRSPYSTADNSYEIKWMFDINGPVYGGLVIDDEGIIYIGSDTVYAIYPNGELKWKYDEQLRISSTPAIDENGILYVGSIYGNPNYFCAIDTSNGDLIWRKQHENIYSSPAIGDDGSIYFGSLNEYIYSYYPNSTLKWKFKTEDFVYSSPAISDDGIVYCGSNDGNLYAIYSNNGTLKWNYTTGDGIGRGPSIADDGTIYFGSWDGYLYAVYPDGNLKWKTGGRLAGTTPITGEDGTIYVGDTKLSAINPHDGTVKWKVESGGRITTSNPCISADGTIYFGNTEGGDIVAVTNNGTEKWRKSIGGNIWSEPAIGEDGTVYVADGSNEGHVYAFGHLDPNAPTAPDINGPGLCFSGKEYEYKFRSTSPLGNKVYYLVNWGDGTVTGWNGTYDSGETVSFYHEWSTTEKITIRALAKDTDNLWGPWSEFEVNIPRTQTTNHPIFKWFLGRFQILERLLELIRQF